MPIQPDPQIDELRLGGRFLERARLAQSYGVRAEIGRCPCVTLGERPCDECRDAALDAAEHVALETERQRGLSLQQVQRRLAGLGLDGLRLATPAEQGSPRALDRRSL